MPRSWRHADVAEAFDKLVAADPDVERFSTYVGQGAIRFYLPLDVALPNDFFAQSVVVTKGLKQREQVRARLEQALATHFPQVVARVYPLELGPPVGWPVKYPRERAGPEPRARDRLAGRPICWARQRACATSTSTGSSPARVMRIRMDQDQARQLGLSSEDVAVALNDVVTGSTVTQVRDSIYLIDVVARSEQVQRTSLESLRSLQIPLSGGRVVPLRQIASFEYTQEYPIVWRRDRVPTVTVQADVVPGLLPATAVQAIQPAMDKLAATLPNGYHIATGGSVEESGKAKASVIAVVPAMVLLVLTILMVQLQSFQLVLVVLSVAPLGLHRRGGSLVARAGSARLCRDPRRAGAGRHDRAELGHLDRPGGDRKSGGPASMGRGRRRRDQPHTSHPAHRVRHHARHDSDRADSLLGTDGVRNHRRPDCSDGADADLPARPVCRLVPDRGTCGGQDSSPAGGGRGACITQVQTIESPIPETAA